MEFDTEEDETGRIRATLVTGPNGGPVQGAPRQPYGGGGGFGGGGGGFGGGGGGFGGGDQGGFGGGGSFAGDSNDDDDDMWKPKS